MRIFGLCVTRNEENRYFEQFLAHNMPFFDELVIYDDLSTDFTVPLAQTADAIVATRLPDAPGFIEHEGKFRQSAWDWLRVTLNLNDQDWVFVIDADEFIIGDLRKVVADATEDVINITIPEVFDICDGSPMLRLDGFWGNLSRPRLAKYNSAPIFNVYRDVPMACGSLPAVYEIKASGLPPSKDVTLLHYGYARAIDRVQKHYRYSLLPGHSSSHIESILTPPTLIKWPGDYPKGVI